MLLKTLVVYCEGDIAYEDGVLLALWSGVFLVKFYTTVLVILRYVFVVGVAIVEILVVFAIVFLVVIFVRADGRALRIFHVFIFVFPLVLGIVALLLGLLQALPCVSIHGPIDSDGPLANLFAVEFLYRSLRVLLSS